MLFEPAFQQQGGGQCVHRVVPVAAALALGQALAFGLEGGQAFVMGVHRQLVAAMQAFKLLIGQVDEMIEGQALGELQRQVAA